MTLEQRKLDRHLEAQWLRYILRELPTHGWRLVWVDDGEETHRTSNPTEAFNHANGVDEAWIGFQCENWTFQIFVVWNAGPWEELLNDWKYSSTMGDTLEGIMTELERKFRALLDSAKSLNLREVLEVRFYDNV